MYDSEQGPLSDLAHDCISLIQNKSQAIRAYETYIEDARRANSPECVDLFRRICEQDRRQIEEAKHHLQAVLNAERAVEGLGQGGVGLVLGSDEERKLRPRRRDQEVRKTATTLLSN